MSEATPSASPDRQLGDLRIRIDDVDTRLLELLNERARLALEVGEVKKLTNAPVYRPEREAQVIARLRGLNPGPLGGDAIEAIQREVMSACRELERRNRLSRRAKRRTKPQPGVAVPVS